MKILHLRNAQGIRTPVSGGPSKTSPSHMSTLPVENLYAGDVVIYYRSGFVANEESDGTESIVVNILSGGAGIELVNGERLSLDRYIKRLETVDRSSSRLVAVRGTCSRPISSFTLHEGEIPERVSGNMIRGCTGIRDSKTGVGSTSGKNISDVNGGEVQSREVSEALSGLV